MYNLLVQFNPWEEGRGSVLIIRLFEYTDEMLKNQFKDGNSALLDKLIQLPCLFMQEGSGDELAHVGTITRAKQSDTEILIDFSYDHTVHPIPNQVIFANKLDFGLLRGFEFNRTHWAVKEIDLFRTLLRLPQPLRQYPKVFSISKTEAIERTLVSVMMPFNVEFADVYVALQEVAADVGFRCNRADEIWEDNTIIQDIVTLIDKAFVVVCDCTGRNPNVFYEIGIAHSLGREVVLITQAEEDIPFDLRHHRYIKYLNNGEGRLELKAKLSARFNYLQEKL